jgi:hypothetical protein
MPIELSQESVALCWNCQCHFVTVPGGVCRIEEGILTEMLLVELSHSYSTTT